MRKMCIIIAIFVTVFTSSASAVSLEQVKLAFPSIDLYLQGDSTELDTLPLAQITATLDGTPISVTHMERSEEAMFYIYMLDISGSIPQKHFLAAKQEVLTARRTLRPQDSLAVIAFGDAVQTIVQPGQSIAETEAALDTLQAKDDNTLFYTAMQSLVQFALDAKTARCVAIVISDGISEASADMTQAELEGILRNSGVAVNGLCIDSAAANAVQNFKAFLNVSGGDLYPFNPQCATQVFSDLRTRLDESRVLRLEADPSLATGQPLALHIDFGTLAALDTSITPPAPVAVPIAPPQETPPIPQQPVEQQPGQTKIPVLPIVGGVLVLGLVLLFVLLKRRHKKHENEDTSVKFIFMDQKKK